MTIPRPNDTIYSLCLFDPDKLDTAEARRWQLTTMVNEIIKSGKWEGDKDLVITVRRPTASEKLRMFGF